MTEYPVTIGTDDHVTFTEFKFSEFPFTIKSLGGGKRVEISITLESPSFKSISERP